jgi:hypothetical protein
MKDTLREIFVISTHSDYSDIMSHILQTKMSVYSISYLGMKKLCNFDNDVLLLSEGLEETSGRPYRSYN